MNGAVSGPRIVDFSTHMSGPLASHLLAETGATIVKVENPNAGDGNRGLEPFIHDRGMFHVALNSGARSVTVSPRSPHWNTIVGALTRWADAAIVGARPVDAAKRGLDFASLVGHNAELVYCLISGFGDRGPWKDVTAHGQTIDAYAGQVDVEWHEGQPTTRKGWRSAGAQLAGVFAALGVYAGLDKVRRGLGPQHVSVSLWGSATWWAWRDVTCWANLDEPWHDYDQLGSRYGMYATSDGRAILCAPIEKKFWVSFCDLLDLPAEWKERGSWERSGMEFGFDDERQVIASRIVARPLDELTDLFTANAIPHAPLLDVSEVLASEHAAANGVLRSVGVNGGTARVAASPVRFRADADDGDVEFPLLPAPELGVDTDDVLRELGLDDLVGADLNPPRS
jgi:crotonobetainyl-CoA:carnitine CoA-transferase CaiB-like acyl-CoA transferase